MTRDMKTQFSSRKLTTTDCTLNRVEHLEPEYFDSPFLSMIRNQNVDPVEMSKISLPAN